MPENGKNFAGLNVASFESRRGKEMAMIIEKFGGVPHVSPSMREVPLEDNQPAIDFANRVITGQIDIVIFMTGVGFNHLLAAIDRKVDKQRFLDALSDITTICRGPKPVAAMREVNLTPTIKVPEPNTWRDILQTIDTEIHIANQTLVVQEYGVTNASLVAGLEARGANVETLHVYDWDLPEDIGPLAANIQKMIDGKIDVSLFTSANQLNHVLKLAQRQGQLEAFSSALRGTVICSVGPTMSERLRDLGYPVDVEPEHPKMGPLVAAAAERSQDILVRKRQIRAVLEETTKAALNKDAPWYNSAFLKACRREPTDFTPVWLMRQAGRYMKEYRDVRAKTTFLELCANPQLCSEVMCTAVEKLGVDAAIIFSDLLPILQPMGLDLEFAKGEGPVIHNPIREAADVDRVLELESTDSLHYVMETVKQTRADLPSDMPLIGFAGAPFTLASYAIEGGGSRDYVNTKTLMFRDPGAWRELMERFVRAISRYLNAQIAAGAQAVQLFDSWAGALGPDDYRRYVLPYVKDIVAQIAPGVPVINFATGNPALLPMLAESGAAVVGVDWRIRLDVAWETVGHNIAVQGNLDPVSLLADQMELRRRAKDVLDQAAGRPGHIFNLGHGVMQQTPVDNARALVDMVHEMSQRK
ncbi:uroporphyrinogen decarboxylase [Blastopirellula marina]|uniref:Uroporphyrinogen decarboxylase n=1 Tax=Blastopirellula marina TaxID=124 RepID=A0A2S8FYX6_9BACT|nr:MULTISPECIES: uroporphyrinogen decarboxylase [Pirellulaceae]PQO37084.1 uroporphyrinogen decarboxylase [Blastopirellula marina]RCS53799.1 uroporphyrinogen decarboxylase [Bremerella cremea]